MNCGYILRSRVYYADCASQKYSICEKLANLVKIESILMDEVPDWKI